MKWGSFVVITDRRGAEVARFEGYTSPEWLPDGRLLMMGTQCRRGGIWLTDGSLRSLSRVDGEQVNTPAAAPAASPDGKTLAFVWNNQLWSLKLVGQPDLTQLTALAKPVTAAAWSPDGSAIAALMFDVSMPVRSMALFRPGDQKSMVFRDLGVYPYGPISWR
jgi:Tol biopolymer transport system component